MTPGTTAAIVSISVMKLVTYGFCLGIGFWASKRLTNVADEYLLLWSERRKHKIENEIGHELN